MLELFRKYRTALLVGCLILVALLVYSANLRQRASTTLFERALLQMMTPVQNLADFAWSGFGEIWGRYLWLVHTAEKNARLERENRRLKAELDGVREVRLSNDRLQTLLDFRLTLGQAALPAQVVGEDASSWARTVLINKGADDGVIEGLPVVVPEGVVGRVIRVAPRQSRVLLITDASSALAVLVQRNRTRGVCRGRGDALTFDFALRQEDIAVGDQIVTSGTGGVFPKGLAVGLVTQLTREDFGLFQSILVTPSVDFSRLEEVLVLLPEQP